MIKRKGVVIAILGCCLMAGCATVKPAQRYGWVTGLKPEKIAYYKELHGNPWPGVIAKLKECHVRNYSIYLAELEPGRHYLFSYLEYTGDDFQADMKKMAADPTTQKWWKETDPCQQPVSTKKDKGIWMDMERVFFME